MKHLILLAILITISVGTLTASAATRKKPTAESTCDALTQTPSDPAELSTNLQQQQLKYYLNQNGGFQVSGIMGDPEVVQAAHDAVVIRQPAGLKLVRQEKLGSNLALSVALNGDEIVRFEKLGEYYLVISKGKEGAQRTDTFYFQLIHQSLKTVEYVKHLKSVNNLIEHPLPDQSGTLFQLPGTLLSVYTKGSMFGGLHRSTRLSEVSFDGKISRIEFDPEEQDTNLVRVYYKGRAMDSKVGDGLDSAERIAWIDYTGSTIHHQRFNNTSLNLHLDLNYTMTNEAEIDLPENTQVKFVHAVGGRRRYTLLYNLANGQATRVKTFQYSSNEGSKFESKDVGNLIVDLSSLETVETLPMFTLISGKAKYLDDKDRGFVDVTLLAPNARDFASTHIPMILRSAKIVYRAGEDIVIESDSRLVTGARSKLFSPSLAWQYLYISSKGFDSSFSFNSSLPLREFDVTPPVPITRLGAESKSDQPTNIEHPFFFATAEGADNPGRVIVNRLTGETMWIAHLHKIQLMAANGIARLAFWGEQNKNGKVIPLLSVYNVTSKQISIAKNLDSERTRQKTLASSEGAFQIDETELTKKLKYLQEPDNVLIKSGKAPSGTVQPGFYKGGSFGNWAERNEIQFTYLDDFSTLSVEFTGQRQGNLSYLLRLNEQALNAEMYGRVFEPELEFADSLQADSFKVIASENYQDKINPQDEEDGIPGIPHWWRSMFTTGTSQRRIDETHVTVLRRTASGQIESIHTVVKGKLSKLRFVKDGNKVYAIGNSTFPGLAKDLTSEFRWDLKDKDVENVLFNKVEEPLYRDKEYEIVVSKRSSEGEPKVVIFRKGEIIGKEISLEYQFKEQEKKSPIDEFFDYLYGRSSGGPQANKQNIGSIKKEGELLFVTTEKSPEQGSLTFVYNLSKSEVTTVIPNYRRHIDIGKLRFYIGESDHTHPTIVAVFNNTNNRFITYFDFGRLKLDTSSAEAVTTDGDFVRFATQNGSVRVYDTRDNYFLGTIPKDVKELLQPIEGMGTVWNTEIFQSPLNGFYQRDEFMTRLMRAFPLRPGRFGGNHALVLGESGVGSTEAFKNFVYRYITGDLQPKPMYRAVFLKLDPNMMASDTMFRGQKAAKFKNLREVAKALQSSGYRLVVVVDGLHKLMPDGDIIRGDDEGDFFSTMKGIMEGGELDLLASTTPGGAEQLQRRQGEFYNQFKQIVRMEALSAPDTVVAVKAFLNDEFPGKVVMTDSQIELLIDKVSRLNNLRVLPGSVFDILSQVLSDMANAPRRSRTKAVVISDAMINAAVASRTGVPAIFLDRANLKTNKEKMRTYLKSRVKGIDATIDIFVDDLFTFALNTNRSDWPLDRILALGPTGTGKTELIKAVGDNLLSSPTARLKISGEDWKDPSQAGKLKALIYKHVKQFPFNILHFDEFEKMAPENQEVVLSVCDGEISGPTGDKASTALSIVYASSNLGSRDIREAVASSGFGFNSSQLTATDMNQIREAIYHNAMDRDLKPEIKNRFDRYFVFPFLDRDVATIIAEDYLNGIKGSGVESIRARFKRNRIDIRFTQEAIDFVAMNYVDLLMGARRLTINIENGIVREFLTPLQFDEKIKADVGSYVIGYSEAKGGFYLEPTVKK